MKSSTLVRDLPRDSHGRIVAVSAHSTAMVCTKTIVDKSVSCLPAKENEELIELITAHDLMVGVA